MGLRSKIVHSKLFIQRAKSYLTVVNSGMILFLFLSQLEKYGININIKQWIIPIFAITLILLLIFGYLEDRLGFYQEEARAQAKRNPYFKEINDRLERIENKLK